MHSKRQKWLKAYHGFPQEDIDEARAQDCAMRSSGRSGRWREHPYLAGPTYSLADINVLSSVERMPRWVAGPDERGGLAAHLGLVPAHDGAAGRARRPIRVSDEAPPRSTELRAMRQGSAGAT